MVVCTRGDLSVYSWNDHYFISSSMIDCFLLSTVFFSIWIIVACMFLLFFREVISLYVCEMFLIIYSVHKLTLHFLRFVGFFLLIWIMVVRILLNILQGEITVYDCELIVIFQPLYWLILYLLRSVCCFLSFELL